jgi:hypothetical protein
VVGIRKVNGSKQIGRAGARGVSSRVSRVGGAVQTIQECVYEAVLLEHAAVIGDLAHDRHSLHKLSLVCNPAAHVNQLEAS